MSFDVIIIGGGAAGSMAAVTAARMGRKTAVFEKNERIGRKLRITGKGRCNVTNNCTNEVLMSNVPVNPRFLYSAFSGFDTHDVMNFFEELGVPLKTERGNRVFPVSDNAEDIVNALDRELKNLGVKVINQRVTDILVDDGVCIGVKAGGKEFNSQSVLIATGGKSYPNTGSTGDGYKLAESVGHTVTEIYPSLVPLVTVEKYCAEMMGLSLRNVAVKLFDGEKLIYSEQGEMLFTHFGVSGPLIISASAYVGKQLEKKKGLLLSIDLKPALTQEQLDARVLREFEAASNKQFKNCLGNLLPAKMIPVIIRRSEIDPEKKVNIISKEERLRLVYLMKHLEYHVTKLRDYKEAIITKGGIKVKEIDPSTMQSKLVQGVYFAGEVLDVDALTGGFNLQVAWSTGCSAGESIW